MHRDNLVRYAALKENDIVDGSGINVSFWTQGCPFHCKGCHNPHTWDFKGGKEIKYGELIDEILEDLTKNNIERNLSILGGEPLCIGNLELVASIIKDVKDKYPKILVNIWTGYKFYDLQYIRLQNSILDYIMRNTSQLVDGQYEEDKKDLSLGYAGSSNQRRYYGGFDF